MIKYAIYIAVLMLGTQNAIGQVGIGTTAPENSSILDISSTKKGFLPPRLTKARMQSIAKPAEGLVVYCTNCCTSGSINFYTGSLWKSAIPSSRCVITSDFDFDGILDNVDVDDDNDGVLDTDEGYIPATLNDTGVVLAGNTSSYTFGVSSFSSINAKMANLSNFGSGGAVTEVSVSVVPAVGTIDSTYLSQGRLLFDGYTTDASYTATEINSIDKWVRKGNVLMSTNDYSTHDPIGSNYGLFSTVTGGAIGSNWTIENVDHPLVNGDVGLGIDLRGQIITATGGYSGFTGTVLSDDIVLARGLSNVPTVVLRPLELGYILFTGDEGVFRTVSSGSTFSTLDNDDIFAAAILAWALETSSEEITTDYDSDNIPDHLDLDSDNDGCSDAYEASATTNTDENFQFDISPVSVGLNGLHNSLEDTDNSNPNYTYVSTYNTKSQDGICIGKDLSSSNVFNNCDLNGFEGIYIDGESLIASNVFSVTLINNNINTTLEFAVGDLILSGVSGMTVSSVNPSSATILAGDSQRVEYKLTGIPSHSGILSGNWTKLGLNCTKTVNVVTGDATVDLSQTVLIVSTNDGTPLENFQGVVDNSANQLTVSIPYTSGVGTYGAYAGVYTLNNSGTSEAGDANSFRVTYPSGTFSTSGNIIATIEVDGDGSFNAEKQLFGIRETIAALEFQINGNSKGNLILDVIGGIPDRNFTDDGHKFIYLPVIAADGNVWLNNNLGANYANVNHTQFNISKQATAHNDYHAYGSLFQWGRYSDGHELINFTNSTTGTPVTSTTSSSHATTITPNNSTFYLGDNSPGTQDHNWLDIGASPNAIENNLWQGESGINNPCPQGYRLPSETEMSNLVIAESITNFTNAASSSLALSAVGYRSFSNGVVSAGSSYNANYWTNQLGGTNSRYSRNRYFTVNVSGTNDDVRAYALSVRCLKD